MALTLGYERFVRESTDASGNTVLVGADGSASFNDAGLLGASPSATAAINSAAIQSALDAGGAVTLSTPGTYLISKTLLIGDYTELRLGAGVVLKLVDNAKCALIKNIDSQNALRATDFAVADGTAVVTEYGHTRAVGSQVYVEGALTNTDLNGVQTITAATDTTWSYACAGADPTNADEVRIMVSRHNLLAGSNFVRASNVVTVTETGHKRCIGDHVHIAGLGGADTFNGPAKIVSVTKGVSWAYANTGTDETATGTANLLGNTHVNLVNFQYDGNRENQVAVDEWLDFSANFGNLGNSYFDLELVQNYTWRGLNFFNCGNINIPRATFGYGHVGIQFESHCDAINIGTITGRGMTDDVLAWGVTEQSGLYAETASPSGMGDMGTLKVTRIDGQSPTAMLKLFAHTGYSLGMIDVGTITGQGRGIATASGTGVSGGTLDRLLIGNLDVTPQNAGETTVALGGLASYGTVRINNAKDNATALATTFFCNIISTQIDRLIFDNLESENYGTSYPAVMVNNGGTVNELVFNNPRLTAGNGGNAVRIPSGGTVRDLRFNNLEFSGAGAAGSANYYGDCLVVQSGGTLKHLWVNGVSLTTGQGNTFAVLGGISQTIEIDVFGMHSLSDAGKMTQIFTDNSGSVSANVRFHGMRFATGPANQIFRLSGSGAWSIKGSGLHMPVANKFAFLTTGTVNVSIDCPEVQLDMGANAGSPPARLVPVAGDRLWNTNATGGGLYGYTAAGAWALIF